MSETALLSRPQRAPRVIAQKHSRDERIRNAELAFYIGFVSIIGMSWLLATLMPLTVSMVAVLLFAGPHNWIEARYMLTRLPARLGPLRRFFLMSITGVIFLTTFFVVMPVLGSQYRWSSHSWLMALSLWNTLTIAWAMSLIHIRRRTAPRREWPWLVPCGLTLLAAAWLLPGQLATLLVFAHPLLSLWLLQREIHRTSRLWLSKYHWVLFATLISGALLILTSLSMKPLDAVNVTETEIIEHSGGVWFSAVPARTLVSLHAFLELVHYGVWIWAIPRVNQRVWKPLGESVPMARKSIGNRRAIKLMLSVGAIVVVALWVGFVADYSTTREIYFAVAMGHVLAEIPFLLRAL